MRERRSRLALAFPSVLAVVAALGTAQVAWASFSGTSTASAGYSSGLLAAPTNAAAGPGACSLFSSDSIVLSWTASSTTSADGYEIARSTAAVGPYTVVATVAGAASTTYTDTPLSFSTTYFYAIRTYKYAWRSLDATASRTTRSSLCI